MHMASSIPQQHFTSCDAVDVIAQVAVRTKDDLLILRQTAHDFLGIGRGHHHVGHSLNGSAGVDITDYRVVGMLVNEFFKLVGGAAVGQRATGTQVGHDHRLVRAQDLGGLAHEMNTAQDNYRRVGLSRQLCQRQAIADVICQLLDFLTLVIMRHDDCIALLLQAQDFLFQVDAGLDRLIDVAFFNIHIIIYFVF